MPLQPTYHQAQQLVTFYRGTRAISYPSARTLATFLDDCYPQHNCHRHPEPPDRQRPHPLSFFFHRPTKRTDFTYSFATIFAIWEKSIPTYAKAFASSSFYLAHQARQAIIEWTHQLLSHPPPPAISSLHHLPPLSTPTSSPPQHSLITHLIPRDRSRSRDRHPPNNTSASPHNLNLYISSRQPLSDRL